jgi:hypothetical protein
MSGRRHRPAVARGSLLAAAAAVCLSGCASGGASSQVQPALAAQWGPLGQTYVLVTPTQDDLKTVSFNVTGQVGASVRSAICAKSSLEVGGSVSSPAYCRWFVDKTDNNVGQLRFATTTQFSSKLQITLRNGSAELTLTWEPSGFFGGYDAGLSPGSEVNSIATSTPW